MGLHANKEPVGSRNNVVKMPGSMPATKKRNWKGQLGVWAVDVAIGLVIVGGLLYGAGFFGPVK